MFNKRINIFTGHFGSGKTEVAVNFALGLCKLYDKVAIVDFDIVNPYFRTADARDELERSGIKVIAPLYANTNVDVPALPAEINTLFERPDYRIVFDVGGDDLGAKVLSRYNQEILNDDYEMFFVVNTKRPMTDTPEKIEEMVRSIQESSRLKITRFINNTNLLNNTSSDDIIAGHELISRVAEKFGVPVAFVSGFPEAVNEAGNKLGIDVLVMNKLIRLPWDN